LERARKQLQLFDTGNAESLFYAALELRLGIESRISNELKVLLDARKMPEQKFENYSLGKLFKKLTDIDENTLESFTVTFSAPGGGTASALQYTPVTKEFLKDWGRLSNIIHYSFFLNEENKEWYHKEKIFPNKDGMRSLVDYREMLSEIAGRLENASSGNLIIPPTFLLQFINEIDDNAKE
jgi:hypothetical protein